MSSALALFAERGALLPFRVSWKKLSPGKDSETGEVVVYAHSEKDAKHRLLRAAPFHFHDGKEVYAYSEKDAEHRFQKAAPFHFYDGRPGLGLLVTKVALDLDQTDKDLAQFIARRALRLGAEEAPKEVVLTLRACKIPLDCVRGACALAGVQI